MGWQVCIMIVAADQVTYRIDHVFWGIFIFAVLLALSIWFIVSINDIKESLRNINKLLIRAENKIYNEEIKYEIPHRQCPECGYYTDAKEPCCCKCGYEFKDTDEIIQ